MKPSDCLPGQENYCEFNSPIANDTYVHYYYRTPKGALFFTVALSLERARGRRDAWLKRNAPTVHT